MWLTKVEKKINLTDKKYKCNKTIKTTNTFTPVTVSLPLGYYIYESRNVVRSKTNILSE